MLLRIICLLVFFFFFFFNDTATTEIYTLSLHDALPISSPAEPHLKRHSISHSMPRRTRRVTKSLPTPPRPSSKMGDRKSTRLNSSHLVISYAVFCLKKKKKTIKTSARYSEKDETNSDVA